jgi:hypothetical protein
MFNRQDLVSGSLIALTGAAFGASALFELPMGRAVRMGPGFFPVVLSGILIALGLLIAIRAWGRGAPPLPRVSWRGFVLIPLAVISFSLIVRRFGLAPALISATFITAYSSETMTPAKAAALAVGITVFCALIFKWGLNITPPLFGRS